MYLLEVQDNLSHFFVAYLENYGLLPQSCFSPLGQNNKTYLCSPNRSNNFRIINFFYFATKLLKKSFSLNCCFLICFHNFFERVITQGLVNELVIIGLTICLYICFRVP